jgi:hypothetical protein
VASPGLVLMNSEHLPMDWLQCGIGHELEEQENCDNDNTTYMLLLVQDEHNEDESGVKEE